MTPVVLVWREQQWHAVALDFDLVGTGSTVEAATAACIGKVHTFLWLERQGQSEGRSRVPSAERYRYLAGARLGNVLRTRWLPRLTSARVPLNLS